MVQGGIEVYDIQDYDMQMAIGTRTQMGEHATGIAGARSGFQNSKRKPKCESKYRRGYVSKVTQRKEILFERMWQPF
jgi:hypothetical protein